MAGSHDLHGTDPGEQARLSRPNDLINGRSLAAAFDAALDALRSWGRRPDAAMWYAVSWAEGRRVAG